MGAQGFTLPTASGIIDDVVDNLMNMVDVVGVDADANGGAVKFRLREASASGKIISTVNLADGESISDWYAPIGKTCNGDLYIQVVTGGAFLEGTAWVA